MTVSPTEIPATISKSKVDLLYFGSHSRIGRRLFKAFLLQHFPGHCPIVLHKFGKFSP